MWDALVWNDYRHWSRAKPAIRDRINALLEDIQDGGTLGKPLPFGDPAGYESRRISPSGRDG